MKLKQSQTWLFAFTDLAFLLLISLSLIPSAPDNIIIRFSEMEIPDVPSNPNMTPVDKSEHAWELQVHPKTEAQPNPFKLVRIGVHKRGADELSSKYIDRDSLIPELEALKEVSARPMLLPEKTSLSQDFLYAAGAIAKVWSSSSGRTVVKPITPGNMQ